MGGGRIGEQMLAKQCSMLASIPSLITAPPLPCLSVAPSLTSIPSDNLCPLSDHTEREREARWSGGEQGLSGFLLLFIFMVQQKHFCLRGFYSELDYDRGARCTLLLSFLGITTGIVCVCMCLCVSPSSTMPAFDSLGSSSRSGSS